MANIIAYFISLLCILAFISVWSAGVKKIKAEPNWRPTKQEKITFISKTFIYLIAAWFAAYVGANF